MIHVTTPERADQILREGLQPNQPAANPEWGEAYGLTAAQDCYATAPVYLSDPTRPATYNGCVALVVDVDGLALEPDIPLLCDYGFWLPDLGGLDCYVGEEGFPAVDEIVRMHADQCSVVLDGRADEEVITYVREHGFEKPVFEDGPQEWRIDVNGCDPQLAARIRELMPENDQLGFYWDTLLSPELAGKLIELTGSACVLQPIPADRIEPRIYAQHEIQELIRRFSRPELPPVEAPSPATPTADITGLGITAG